MYILTRAHRSTEMHKKLFSARGKLPSSEGAIGTQPKGFARAVSVDTDRVSNPVMPSGPGSWQVRSYDASNIIRLEINR